MAVLVISYSRADRAQVRGIVSLLRGAMRGVVEQAVFWDGQLEPGDVWFDEIRKHIDAAPQLFVFWCAHSSASSEVRREFLYAFERKKNVIPVLLDDTPLSEELGRIHGIDLRGVVQHGDGQRSNGAAPAATGWRRVESLAAAIAIGALTLALAWMLLAPPDPPGDLNVQPVPPPVATVSDPPPGGPLSPLTRSAIDEVWSAHRPGSTRIVIKQGTGRDAERTADLVAAYILERYGVEARRQTRPAQDVPLDTTVELESALGVTGVVDPGPSSPRLWPWLLVPAVVLLGLFWLFLRRARRKRELYIVDQFTRHLAARGAGG
jgi:hypothetical protein